MAEIKKQPKERCPANGGNEICTNGKDTYHKWNVENSDAGCNFCGKKKMNNQPERCCEERHKANEGHRGFVCECFCYSTPKERCKEKIGCCSKNCDCPDKECTELHTNFCSRCSKVAPKQEECYGMVIETAERIVIDYANFSGREDAHRAEFRAETIKHLQNLVLSSEERVRNRRNAEIYIMMHECDEKGWDLKKFIAVFGELFVKE